MKYSLGKLLFSKDMLIQFQVKIDWEKMRLQQRLPLNLLRLRVQRRRVDDWEILVATTTRALYAALKIN